MQYLVDYYFDVPGKPFPGVVTVGVLGQASPVVPGGLGWLKGISPEETRHAFLFAVARDIKKELPVGAWKQAALSVIMEYQFLESEEDYFWESTKIRESIGAQFETMYYSSAPALAATG